jgi:hypothetical protein
MPSAAKTVSFAPGTKRGISAVKNTDKEKSIEIVAPTTPSRNSKRPNAQDRDSEPLTRAVCLLSVRSRLSSHLS